MFKTPVTNTLLNNRMNKMFICPLKIAPFRSQIDVFLGEIPYITGLPDKLHTAQLRCFTVFFFGDGN